MGSTIFASSEKWWNGASAVVTRELAIDFKIEPNLEVMYMFKKSTTLHIILIIVSSLIAFITGQSYKHLGIIDSLLVSIDGLRYDLRSLERELIKQTGIVLPTKDTNNEETFTKAEVKLKQGEVAIAGLYFSNAVAQDPGNWAVLQRYQRNLLNYCQQLTNNGNFDMALLLLSDVETFLRSQAIYLKTSDINNLEQALIGITKLRQQITATQLDKNRQENEKQLTVLLTKSDEILNQSTVNNEASLTIELQEILDSLKSIDTAIFTDSQVAKINDKVAMLEKRLNVTNVEVLVQRITQFIDLAKQEPAKSEFVLYYLTSAETMIRQLVLAISENLSIKQQIAQLTKKLDDAKEIIAKSQSKSVWNVIETAYTEIKIDETTEAQDALKQLLEFRKFLGQNASKIASIEFQEQAQTLMDEVNSRIEKTQSEQLHSYNAWAINTIQQFHADYKDQLGLGTDVDKVYNGMVSTLGIIDTRYLSTPAQTAYNEVFNMFYAELNSDQKIPLSAEMTLKEKKKFTEF